ncbi:MAG TPA: glycosyltransferase family 87 protein, partial [Solirubrobacteraceae bacterium]|nr:glycosyltransferase family 87 protein [Solirubrobacteraceae bacterium]
MATGPTTVAPSIGALTRAIAVALVPVAAIALAFLPLTPAYDVDVFLRAGNAATHSLQVYPTPGTPAVYSGFSFVYPYFALWPFMLLAELPAALGTAIVFSISVLAVIAACMIPPSRGPWRAVLVLCTAFTITGLQLGALSPMLFGGLVLLWRVRGRARLFVLAGPVIATKLFLAPMLLWLLLARRYRAFAWASASTIALLSVGFVLGPIDPDQYANMLSQLGAHEAQLGFGLIGALMDAGIPMSVAQASALALAVVVLLAVRHRYRRTHDERALFCACLVASLLLTPVLWSHYLVLFAAALLAYDAPRRWFALLALTSWAISPPHGVPHSTLIQAAALAAA